MVVKSSCVTSVSPLDAGDAGSPADRAALAVSAVRSKAFRFAADTCFTSRRTCRLKTVWIDEAEATLANIYLHLACDVASIT